MSSFPSRVTRAEYGPDFEDTRPVEHPETEFGAEKMNLLLWQSTGMNMTAARLSLVASWVSSAFQIAHQGEAWNPKNEQDHPVLARTGTGVYTYTLAATYPDIDGNDVAPSIGAPRVTCHKVLTAFADRIVAEAWRDASLANVIHIRLWDATGTAVDEPFWLEAL
jgi:hypothetical protein